MTENQSHKQKANGSYIAQADRHGVAIVGESQHIHVHPHPPGSTSVVGSVDLPPKPYSRLIGRSIELDRIMNAMREPERKPMISVVGLGGIGKTALAREAIELCQREQLFDHIVWTTAKVEYFVGEETVKVGVSDYNLDALLDDIGKRCNRKGIVEMSPDEKRVAVKYLLKSNHVLIVTDNLETVPRRDELVNGVFQILGKSKLLITSRHRIKHERVFTIDLEGFAEDEGVVFLREESRERGIEEVAQANRNSLVEIHQVTGGAPLAMKLVIGQMSRLGMNIVLENLKDARFEGPDYKFYRFVFHRSWALLNLDAKKTLVSMSVFAPVIGGTEETIRAVNKVEKQICRESLDQLVLMSLVSPTASIKNRRYTIHQLTYYFILSDIVKKWG